RILGRGSETFDRSRVLLNQLTVLRVGPADEILDVHERTAFRQFENLETALHDEGFVPVGGGMRDEGQYLQAYVVAFGDVDEVFELGSHDVGAADQAVETGLVDDDVEMQRRVRT